jgi:N-acetylglucosaminyldiphosphoundecaprenol N-acetyl-beta-D-mannosaminyltransferase
VAEIAAERLRKDPGVVIAGAEGPRIGVEALPDEEEVIERVRAARPDLVVVGLGAPKQERFIDRAMQRLAPAVCLGLGATIEFIAGTLPRAPRWLSRAGLEWAYRLAQDPRRLARRYLWNDPRFLGILLRTLREPKDTRVSCSR